MGRDNTGSDYPNQDQFMIFLTQRRGDAEIFGELHRPQVGLAGLVIVCHRDRQTVLQRERLRQQGGGLRVEVTPEVFGVLAPRLLRVIGAASTPCEDDQRKKNRLKIHCQRSWFTGPIPG